MNNKDIIKQYLNTGKRISEYQFNKLNNNQLNTYIRKRQFNGKDIYQYEFDSMKNFEGNYDIELYKITYLKHGYIFNNKGYVILSRIDCVPSNTIFGKNVVNIYLSCVISLGDNIVLQNTGTINLNKLTFDYIMSKNVTFGDRVAVLMCKDKRVLMEDGKPMLNFDVK